jgi:hypothetical protein
MDKGYEGTVQDTVRIAVLPFQYTGISENENELMWASGLRVLLSSFLESHPRVRVQDREALRESLKLAQLNRFGADIDLKPTNIEGADFVVMGNYFMGNASHFSNLEIRMISVESGAVVAQMHLSRPQLSIYSMPKFLEDFGNMMLHQLRLDPKTLSVADRMPCKNQGLRPFMEASALRDKAAISESRSEALELYAKVLSLYETSRHYFCGTWLDTEVTHTQQAQTILKSLETAQ